MLAKRKPKGGKIKHLKKFCFGGAREDEKKKRRNTKAPGGGRMGGGGVTGTDGPQCPQLDRVE